MLCLRKASATTLIALADASIPRVVSGVYINGYCRLTCLDNIGPDVIETSIDLLLQEWRRRMMYILNTERILRCQSRRSCHSIAAMSGDNFLVCL